MTQARITRQGNALIDAPRNPSTTKVYGAKIVGAVIEKGRVVWQWKIFSRKVRTAKPNAKTK